MPSDAAKSNFTAFMEADGRQARTIGKTGVMMRWVFLGVPETREVMLER